ncbi:hypothetical protein QMA04_08305 [Planococcus sp. APC 3900]|uniref:hypothetical protein n=1 Tax=Planococcus sp. APC 3900 TaxID=3035191 RepID=UPI0025B5D372|nr:hypothetical protein [Planococcus sp. APC 3900]MDN3438093.1 hypothetical protein [Planococcus sp. APC 3900]
MNNLERFKYILKTKFLFPWSWRMIGGFLYQLLDKDASQDNLEAIVNEHYKEILAFAKASGALATTGKGAISALPSKEQVVQLIR